MGADVLLSTAAAVVSLYAACFHAWVFALHRRAHDHAWAALTGAGACLVSWGTASLFGASDASAAFRAQQIQSLGAPLVTLGALGFTATRLEAEIPRLLRAGSIAMGTIFTLTLLAPRLLFQIDATPNTIPIAGRPLLHLELTALGGVALAMVLPLFLSPIVLCVRARMAGREGTTPLLIVVALWTAAGCSDTLVGVGLIDFPFLNPTGGYWARRRLFGDAPPRPRARARRLGAARREPRRGGAHARRRAARDRPAPGARRAARGDRHARGGRRARDQQPARLRQHQSEPAPRALGGRFRFRARRGEGDPRRVPRGPRPRRDHRRGPATHGPPR